MHFKRWVHWWGLYEKDENPFRVFHNWKWVHGSFYWDLERRNLFRRDMLALEPRKIKKIIFKRVRWRGVSPQQDPGIMQFTTRASAVLSKCFSSPASAYQSRIFECSSLHLYIRCQLKVRIYGGGGDSLSCHLGLHAETFERNKRSSANSISTHPEVNGMALGH